GAQERQVSGEQRDPRRAHLGEPAAQRRHRPGTGRLFRHEQRARYIGARRPHDDHPRRAGSGGDHGLEQRPSADNQRRLVSPGKPHRRAPGKDYLLITTSAACPGHAHPPMAAIGRSGWRNDGSLMPCPGSFTATARRHRSASSSSLAPARNGPRRSLSVLANRQLRTWPSAVSRTRSQVPQNGLVTDAITPTLAGPPFTRNVCAGAEPRSRSSSAEMSYSLRSAARISSAVTISERRQPCWASSGICSMNRSSYPYPSANRKSSGASSS